MISPFLFLFIYFFIYIYIQGTYTDQPKLNKEEADRVARAVQTEMDSRNFKTLVTARKLEAFGLISKLINECNHSEYMWLLVHTSFPEDSNTLF